MFTPTYFAPHFGDLALWGIDSLLTYHYLEAELFRSSTILPADYWALDRPQRADLIWRTLFVENPPVSESARGVVAVLQALVLDSQATSLAPLREFFRQQDIESYVGRIFTLAGVESVVMTNDPLDPAETAAWNTYKRDSRFRAALRLDRILNHAGDNHPQSPGDSSRAGATAWIPPTWPSRFRITFQFPAQDLRNALLVDVVLPICLERRLPLALMIGVRRQVNPALRLAGDASAGPTFVHWRRFALSTPVSGFW